jgi:hypothetical protein
MVASGPRSGQFWASLGLPRGKVPGVASTLRALPDTADHPTFRIIASAKPDPANRTPA